MEKHFDLTVTDDDLQWSRNREKIKAEARLDGIYVIRTNLDTAAIDTHAAVAAYKSLSQVERAFRSMKMTRLHVRPVFVLHRTARARACVPSACWPGTWNGTCAGVWHPCCSRMRPLRCGTHRCKRPNRRSKPKAKAATKRTPDGDPVHSVTTLLNDLATVTLNEVTLPGHPDSAFPLVTKSTPLQAKGVRFTENRSRGSCCHKQGRLILNKLPLYN